MSRLTMRKISEILRQRYELGRGYRDIATSLNISISTVSDYLSRAKLAGLTWPLPAPLSEQELYDKLFLPSPKGTARIYPDWEWVHKELRRKGVTLLLLWREYREQHPSGIGYTQFCNCYRQFAKTVSPVMRIAHKAGEKVFVDYAGMTMPWINPSTGEIFEAQIFVGSLGASQYTFAYAYQTQQLPEWIDAHVRMFEFFGGVTEVVVPDNLRSGVKKAHRYDPDINPNYQWLGEHYGVAIVPARAATPKDKGKVENAVGCVERQILAPLRHRTFTSIAEINDAIKPLLTAFNTKKFQKMDSSRQALFEKLDKPALKPLPPARYVFAQWKKATVNVDYHFVFDDHYYSAPHQYISKSVQLRANTKTVECFYKGERIAVHQRSYQPYKFTTLTEHMPKNHRLYAEWTPERIMRWANKMGPHTAQFVQHLIGSRSFPQQAYRTCFGLFRLGKKYGDDRLEKACNRALIIDATRYQQVASILKNHFFIIRRK